MAIPQHTIDQILDRTDIVDLISQRVKLKKSGRTYSGCCPFHQEKTPSFHVYRDKQYFHCFGCQANGNAIRFLMDLEQRNFVDVVKELADKAGIELPKEQHDSKKISYQRKVSPAIVEEAKHEPILLSNDPFAEFSQPTWLDEAAPQQGNLYDLLENVAQFYEAQLLLAPLAQNYFQKRGLNSQTIQFWRLGYAPEDWQHLEKAFPQDVEGLKILGLIRTSDSGRDFDLLRDRVIFPIRDNKGRVVGFGGRALNDDIKPKYINSPDSEVFHKNQLLYGLYEGRKLKAQNWLMVEGYMDVIALQQYGISGAVATLGTASNTDHLNLLFKQNSCVTIAFDGDAAGQKAARRTLEIALPLLNDGKELKFFVLPNEHDPDSFIRKEGVDGFQTALRNAPLLSDFIFSLLTQNHITHTPEAKSQIMAELRQLTDLLPKSGSYRYLLQQFFKEKLGIQRKWQPQINHDAALSFNTRIDVEEYVIAMLLQYPYLYTHFEILRALIPQQRLLSHILNALDIVFDHLPEDLEQAKYYVLGANAAYHPELKPILAAANLDDYLHSPEKIDQLAEDFASKLHYQFLKNKLHQKQFSGIQEMQNIKRQLYEIDKKRSLSLLED